MKRPSAKPKSGAKRPAGAASKRGWLSRRLLLGITAYLAIGLVWSILQLASSKPPAYSCPDPVRPGQSLSVDQPTGNGCTRPPEAGLGAKVASVGVGTVLWLPLLIISGLTD
jgi:hypothetical protein